MAWVEWLGYDSRKLTDDGWCVWVGRMEWWDESHWSIFEVRESNATPAPLQTSIIAPVPNAAVVPYGTRIEASFLLSGTISNIHLELNSSIVHTKYPKETRISEMWKRHICRFGFNESHRTLVSPLNPSMHC